MTLDGVKISSLPNKNAGTNKGYDINLVCDGAVGTFDYEKWGILVTNINKENVKCNISFTTKYKEDLLNGSDPVLKNELIPVKISETGVVTYADTKTEWYNYSKKSWANAVILIDSAKSKYKVGNTISESDIESYFVWIPKYAYKVQTLGTSTTIKPFEIRFGTTNTTNSTSECVAPNKSGESGSCAVGKYMTHPAFTSFGSVKGLWVGKFETGYKGSTSVSSAQKNENNPTKVQVKPNVNSWRGISASNMFKTSYNYKRTLDSHMMKNTEWGAVTYLTNSIYGRCTGTTCEEMFINNHSNYITGWSGKSANVSSTTSDGYVYTNTNSGLASTTKNHTGIYDMSGGAYDRVMAFSGAITNGNSGFTTSDNYNAKYYNLYVANTSPTNSNIRILGDATAETHNWFGDRVDYLVTQYPWYLRGGYLGNTTETGIFHFSHYEGQNFNNFGFRLVLAF